jgi:hypothetical protein
MRQERTVQAVGALEARDIGLDTGAEVAELAIDPAASDHVLDPEAAPLVEGELAHAAGLGLAQVGARASAARVAHLDQSEDQAALVGGQVELVAVGDPATLAQPGGFVRFFAFSAIWPVRKRRYKDNTPGSKRLYI